MKISCDAARPLVPPYLDGELSEVQASPLRAHLLDCPSCREGAKEGKALARWFVAEPGAVAIPAGFAARVARRAFAGDPGLLVPEPPPVAARRPLLPFLLVATAVAAAALLALALALQRESLPRAAGLDARETPPPWLEAESRTVETGR